MHGGKAWNWRGRFIITGALLLGFAVGGLFVWIKMRLRWREVLDAATKKSVNLSRATLKGQNGEQLAPLLPGFAYAASDARFLGDPIDYIVFHGYTDFREAQSDACDDVELIILDIKRGKSRLSECQRAVAAAIEAGRVRFEVVRISDDGQITTERYAQRKR